MRLMLHYQTYTTISAFHCTIRLTPQYKTYTALSDIRCTIRLTLHYQTYTALSDLHYTISLKLHYQTYTALSALSAKSGIPSRHKIWHTAQPQPREQYTKHHPHGKLHTARYKMHTANCKLHTTHCTLHTATTPIPPNGAHSISLYCPMLGQAVLKCRECLYYRLNNHFHAMPDHTAPGM